MKFLYKFSLRNEQEIRQDLPARIAFVVADSMGDAVNGYVDTMSLVESVEFVSPVTVVPSKSDLSNFSGNLLYNIIFRDTQGELRSSFVHACDSFSALSALQVFLGYTPTIEKSCLVDDLVI